MKLVVPTEQALGVLTATLGYKDASGYYFDTPPAKERVFQTLTFDGVHYQPRVTLHRNGTWTIEVDLDTEVKS